MAAVTGKENTTLERVRPQQRPIRSDFLAFPEINPATLFHRVFVQRTFFDIDSLGR